MEPVVVATNVVNLESVSVAHEYYNTRLRYPDYDPPGPHQSSFPVVRSGSNDAWHAPSNILLIQGLEPTVTEEILAKGVSKLLKPIVKQSPPPDASSMKNPANILSTTGDSNLGATEGSLLRVMLIRDRMSNESWRFGFAEFSMIDVCIKNLPFESSTESTR